MGKLRPRDVSGFLQAMRNLLLGRTLVNPLRFSDFLATRSPSPPNLPPGSAEKLSANYYYAIDGRREQPAPITLADGTSGQKAIGAGGKSSGPSPTGYRPGKVFKWD